MKAASIAALALSLLPSLVAHGIEISTVRADVRAFDPTQSGSVSITLRTDEPAILELLVYDVRERLIRRVSSPGLVEPGSHELAWDGRDERGRIVPPEAYHYVVSGTSESGEVAIFDASDSTGGERVTVEATEWDPDAGVVRYRLPGPARISLRVGLRGGGPLLAAPLEWVPRGAGPHSQVWNGRDSSDVLSLADHPRLIVNVVAFALSENSVIVLPEASETTLVDAESWPTQVREVKRRRRFGDLPMQRYVDRHKIDLRLSLSGDHPLNDDGVPIVRGRISVQADVRDADRARVTQEGFEMMFFVDGEFRFENEVAYLPTSWMLDTSSMNPGIHYVTGNLTGYDGHLAVATLMIDVANEE